MDTTFQALADPTRRLLLTRLRDGGPMSLTDLARGLPMTRQAVTKHLGALIASGLVWAEKVGRQRIHHLNTQPLHEARSWLEAYEAEWDRRLERLTRHLEENP